MKVSDILAPWGAVNTALGLGAPIRDEAHYNDMLRFVDDCFEQFGADDDHPIFVLVDWVALRIREYEDRMHPWPDAGTPQSRLAFLMEQHGLRQCDLPEIGAQSVVSAVLAGKRSLNLRQARALAQRFQVPIEALTGLMEVSAAKRTPAPIHLSMRGPAISTKPHLLQHEGSAARLLEVLEQALKKP